MLYSVGSDFQVIAHPKPANSFVFTRPVEAGISQIEVALQAHQ
jgi:hypothetical protein